MYPFIDPVYVRFENTGTRPVKIGYKHFRPGTQGDVPVSTLHAPALQVAQAAGVEFVGFVIKNQLYDLVPADNSERKAPEEPQPEPEEFVDADDLAEEVPGVLEDMEEEEEEEVPYSKRYKDELIELCENLGIDSSGYKNELVERLEAYDAGDLQESESDEEVEEATDDPEEEDSES